MRKEKLIILFIFAIISMACVCGGGKPTVAPVIPTDTADVKKLLFLFNGESNSGGYGVNTSATAGELAVIPQVQILNNTTLLYEDLDIGTNNTIGHTGITCCTTHGWELEIAQQIKNNPETYGDTAFLIKTGQGGSTIGSWTVLCGAYCDTTYYNIGILFERVNASRSLFYREDIQPVILLSIGINDIISGNSNAYFQNALYAHINTLRAITRDSTPVIITKFFGVNTRYDNAIDSVANNMGLTKVYTVIGTGADTGDTYHWNYSGLKVIANRFLDVINNNRDNW